MSIEARASTDIRPEIQALRALAVSVVVTYHLWPHALRGGFVGVDVFFVISGFLITAHLMREVDRDGRVSLSGFWARRARRILPAALLVLGVTAVATILFVPATSRAQYFADLRASALYVQNWHLADTAVDYLASANAPSAMQHYWSLSVEEQFYLVWPLVIAFAVWVTTRLGSSNRRLACGIALGVLTAASLAASAGITAYNPARAFFITTTRAWEFAAGGLLAISGIENLRPRRVLSWGGLGLIAFASVVFNRHTPFPGTAAAIPVVGALAVIAAGTPEGPLSTRRLFALSPMQVVGDWSYSIYLWHWPLLIIAPFAIGRRLDQPGKIAVVVLTLAAAWATKVAVEDPVRFGPILRSRPTRYTFVATAAAMAIVLFVVNAGQTSLDRRVVHWNQESAALISSHPSCFGAAAHDPVNPCTNHDLDTRAVPAPIAAADDDNAPCETTEPTGLVRPCRFGPPQSKSKLTFAVVGDSHAAHWRAAFAPIADERGWHGVSISRTGCPFSAAVKRLAEPFRSQCGVWNRDVYRWFAKHPEVGLVFVAQISGSRVQRPSGVTQFDAQQHGYRDAWARLPSTVTHIVVMRDTPKVHSSTKECVQQAVEAGESASPNCDVDRAVALRADPAAAAAMTLRSERVRPLDMTEYLCSLDVCPAVIGGALVYKDIHHLTAVFAATLAPLLAREIDALG
ncbi:MAG: hypothetical protein QOI61_1156, partial [Actinomycetota bacterium]